VAASRSIYLFLQMGMKLIIEGWKNAFWSASVFKMLAVSNAAETDGYEHASEYVPR
jgi:hypothetical protein